MKSAEYTVKRMTIDDHTDVSWDELFSCEDEDRRAYKLMYRDRVIDSELTFKQAHEWKAHYEAEDAYAREEAEREEAEREEAESPIKL